MKSCPTCQRVYPDDAGFCPADGTALQHASMVPIAINEDPRIGKKLCGRYELRRVVADGGMGRVYEGIDKQTNTRIAVKVLHDDVARDDIALERFKREYEISSQLPHEHIVHVLDFQQDPETSVWLLVMEFLDGEELRLVIKREKTIPPERVIRMLSQIAVGLAEPHARSIVHRDLKPDNIFLCGTREGDVVKLLDFGSVRDNNKDAKKLTVLGTTIGSPFYMAPEQAQGAANLDARADVFALGAIAYECITGSVPFTGNNGPAILLEIMTKNPVPPSVKGAKAKWPPPQSLDDVLDDSLAKTPATRTKSVGELAEAFGRACGLIGDHQTWAKTPIADLARQVVEGRSRIPQKVLEAVADPFAAPPAGLLPAQQQTVGQAGQAGMMGQAQQPSSSGSPQLSGQASAMRAQSVSAPYGYAQPNTYPAQPAADFDGPAGIPSQTASWLLPVIVGIVALVVGGGIALLVALR